VVKGSLLEPNDITVDNGKTTVILEVDRVGGSARWYRTGGFYAPKTWRSESLQSYRPRAFMPSFSNDKDVQSFIDDCTGKRRSFIVGGACIHATDHQRTIVGDGGATSCLKQALRTTPLTNRLS